MPRAVYSTRFIAVANGTPQRVTYVVPAGFVAVVRSVDIYLDEGPGATAYAGIVDPACSIGQWSSSASGYVTATWNGRQVANAGEELVGSVNGDVGGSILVSGYLLTA